MDKKNSPSTLNNIITIGAIIIFITLAGGVVGFMSQTGIGGAVMRQRNRNYNNRRPVESITRAEYKFRTRTGWWLGCGVGAVISIGAVVALSRRVKLNKAPSTNDPLR